MARDRNRSPTESYILPYLETKQAVEMTSDGRLSDELVETIISFLAPLDVAQVARVNTFWRQVCRRERLWKQYCIARWHLERPEALLRRYNIMDFRHLYEFLHQNRCIPRGRYTTQRQVIWGKNRQEGVDAWLMVAHQPDCRVLSIDQNLACVQFRLIVQNTQPMPVSLDLENIQVYFKDGHKGRILSDRDNTLSQKQLAPRVVAMNGTSVHQPWHNRFLPLRMFEFAVVSVHVECTGCDFESDLLESCDAMWLPLRRSGGCDSLSTCRCALIPDHSHHGTVRVPFVDEPVIWKHYKQVSGRFMVLDCRTSLHEQLLGSCWSESNVVRTKRRVGIL